MFYFLAHPWLRDESRAIPLDILIFKLVKAYLHATPLRRAALKVTTSLLFGYKIWSSDMLGNFFWKKIINTGSSKSIDRERASLS